MPKGYKGTQPLESALQERVILEVKKKYKDLVWIYKTHDMVRVGVPDIIMCLAGHFIAIELKRGTRSAALKREFHPGRDDKDATALQLYNIKKIQKAGGSAFVGRYFQDIMDKIDRIFQSLHFFGEAHK